MPWYYGTGLDGLRISGGMIAEQLNGGDFSRRYFFVGMVSKGGKSPVIRIERAISLKQSEVQSCWIGTALKSG